MKKIFTLLLTLTMILSLCACGGEKNSTTNSPEEQTETENKTNAEAITLNSTIDLDNVTITLEAFEVSTGYSFKSTDTSSGISITRNASIDCPSDMKLICLKGKFTNKTKGDIFPANNPIYGEIVVNGYTYKTKMECYMSDVAESVVILAPMRTVDYYLYAEVPVGIADAIESCTLNIGLVTDLDASKPIFEMSDNDIFYTLEAIPSLKNEDA